MNKKICILLFTILFCYQARADYTTPGTGVNWSLDDLVSNAGGAIIFQDGVYLVNANVFISSNDAVSILNNASLKFAPGIIWQVSGTFIVNPPTGVLFTAQDQAVGFGGLRLDAGCTGQLNKLTFEYASALRIADCSPTLSNCNIRYNTTSTSLGSGAITLFRGKPTIINCQFIQNRRAAIHGGANIENVPKIYGCHFSANNTLNLNVPQINLGSSGVADTVHIIGCEIIGGSINSGGIGVLPTGISNILIKQNLIRGNRYGITLNGGSNINAMICYNRVDFNSIQNDPNLGGSGIAFSGGTGTSHQNTIVTGNVFEGNLWGITIFRQDASGIPIAGSMPNLGNLNNADTSDNGKNHFINNNNSSTPGIDLYNNSSDPIYAMGNYWNTNIEAEVEAKIFHRADNPALGEVTYTNFILPVKLTNFIALKQGSEVKLQWSTSSESGGNYFAIERSYPGKSFVEIGRIAAAGNSSTVRNYTFADVPGANYSDHIYYRIKMVDKDGSYSYSSIAAVAFVPDNTSVKVYPSIVTSGQTIYVEIRGNKAEVARMQVLDASGKLLSTRRITLATGFNKFELALPTGLSAGNLSLRVTCDGWHKTIALLKY